MYKYMDDVEIDISTVKNIKMIHFYHVIKNDEVLEAAMVHYDSDKIINLCTLDKHYDELLAKLFMVYEAEREQNRIIADEYSRTILEKAVLADTAYYGDYISGLEEMKKPFYYQTSYMSYVATPVMKYVMYVLYKLSGKELVWNELESSWFGKGTLKAAADDSSVVFPYVMNAVDAQTYDIRIGNFFTLNHMLQMQLQYRADGITITAVNKSLGVDAKFEYVIDAASSKITQHIEAVINGNSKYNKQIELEKCSKWTQSARFDELIKLDSEHTDYFILPWGQYIALESVADEEQDVMTRHVKAGYVTLLDERIDAFFISYDEINMKESRAKFRIYNFAADVFEEKIYGKNVQVYFDSLGFNSRGYYKTNMADRYFQMK